jgi:hypothetical protein
VKYVMVKQMQIITMITAVSVQSSARPVRRTTAESAPGLAISGNARGKTAISPGFSASRRSPSFIEDSPGLENVSVKACKNSNIPPATRKAGSENVQQGQHKVAEHCKNQQHQPSDPDGAKGKAPLILMVYARRETSKYNRGLDRADRDEDGDQA